MYTVIRNIRTKALNQPLVNVKVRRCQRPRPAWAGMNQSGILTVHFFLCPDLVKSSQVIIRGWFQSIATEEKNRHKSANASRSACFFFFPSLVLYFNTAHPVRPAVVIPGCIAPQLQDVTIEKGLRTSSCPSAPHFAAPFNPERHTNKEGKRCCLRHPILYPALRIQLSYYRVAYLVEDGATYQPSKSTYRRGTCPKRSSLTHSQHPSIINSSFRH
ncbi:hypothetical protein V8F20_000045 [Naviculisporaceae sp. PSN 640]